MKSVRDLLTASARLCGLVGMGENLDGDQAAAGLDCSNGLLAAWNIESLAVPGRRRLVIVCPAGMTPYVFSPSDSAPMRIEQAALLKDGIEKPLEVASSDDYADIEDKSASGPVAAVYFQPPCTLNLWPIPCEPTELSLLIWAKLPTFAHIDDPLDLPAAYERALKYNLAAEWAAEYALSPPEAVVALAISSKADLKRLNHETPRLVCDPALLSMRSLT